MSRRFWPVGFGVVLCIGLLLVVVLASGLGRNPNIVISPLIGKPAANFALQTLDGKRTVSLQQYRGRLVVVNFWASWCLECRQEHDDLRAVWQRYRHRGVALIAIGYRDSRDGAEGFLRRYAVRWPTLQDPEQRTAIDYGVYGVPETFVVDRNGIIRYKFTGPVEATALGRQLDTLLTGEA